MQTPMNLQGNVTGTFIFLLLLQYFHSDSANSELLPWSRQLTKMHEKSRWAGADQLLHLYLGAPGVRLWPRRTQSVVGYKLSLE